MVSEIGALEGDHGCASNVGVSGMANVCQPASCKDAVINAGRNEGRSIASSVAMWRKHGFVLDHSLPTVSHNAWHESQRIPVSLLRINLCRESNGLGGSPCIPSVARLVK